jgi:hypothetical protein
VKEAAFRLDGLLVSEVDTHAPLVFVEVQFQPDGDCYARWFSEIFLYLYRRAVGVPWSCLRAAAPMRAVSPPSPRFWSRLGSGGSTWTSCSPRRTPLGLGLELIGLILSKPPESAARALVQGAAEERDWIPDWAERILAYKLA